MKLPPWFTPALLSILLGCPVCAAAGEATSPPPPGEAMVLEFLRQEVAAIQDRSPLAALRPESWPERRLQLRRELQEMLGLLPEPPRGDLRVVTTGVLHREELGIVVEKLHFQPVPGLYVTANLYRPRTVEGRIPAVLYLSGHGQVKVGTVACGAKAHYQHHPAWFARNGTICLVLDTLENGEIPGTHHGTYELGLWWWPSRGYTPAGVEAWSSVRAIDYLESRPDVDPRKIGVTGRSGGGTGTWWLAALDDRPLALAPVAGLTDLENHVVRSCIDGHCDCNYPVNLYRWDYPAVAALAAPRPLLHCNSDKDAIFPLDGVLRIHTRLRELYDGLGARGKLGLLITEGPHLDTQELQLPVFRWMERWLHQRTEKPIAMAAEKLFDPLELKVLKETPPDQRNSSIQETFVPRAPEPEVPADREGFEALRARLLEGLCARTFRNEPDPGSEPLDIEPVARSERQGLLLRGYRFRSEGPVRLPLWVVSGSRAAEPSLVVLNALDEPGWKEWLGEVAGSFSKELGVDPALGDPAREAALKEMLTRESWGFAILPPRGIGPTRMSGDPKRENQLRRRFLAIGRTLEETRVHDLRRAVRALERIGELSRAPLWLQAQREMAGIALYAGIFEPAVKRFELWSLPASHQEAICLLNVLRVLDLPQAVALAFPRQVNLYNVAPEPFGWTRRAAALFAAPGAEGKSPLSIRTVPTGPAPRSGKPKPEEL
jgi:hypothetical protein